jgi:hypothetical protein
VSFYVTIAGPRTILIESATSAATDRFAAHPDLVELVDELPSVVVPEGAVARAYPDEWLARWVVLGVHGIASEAELDRWVDDGGGGCV